MQRPDPLHPGPATRLNQPLVGGLALRRGRAHQFSGPARRSLAAVLISRTEGVVLWIGADSLPDRLFPDGLQPFADPGRLVFAAPRGTDDLVWSVEIALASGAAALVIADLAGVPAPAPLRRLILAVGTGAASSGGDRPAPLGILLTPDGTASGAESRWRMVPLVAPGPDMALSSTGSRGALRWRLDRIQAPGDPPESWLLVRGASGQTTLGDTQPAGR